MGKPKKDPIQNPDKSDPRKIIPEVDPRPNKLPEIDPQPSQPEKKLPPDPDRKRQKP